MKLDLTSLRDALTALNKSLGYLNSDLAKDLDLREQFRAAAIQAFEFTHELTIKMLKRRLEQISASPTSLDGATYMWVIRTGAEAGLIADPVRFRDYRDKRNITSHTYDVKKAEEIAAVLPDFAADVQFLLDALERANLEPD